MSLSILRFTCAVKSTIEILNIAEISQNVFERFAVQNLCCFHVANFFADGKIFYSRSTLNPNPNPENFLLLFLKTVSSMNFCREKLSEAQCARLNLL